VRTEDQRLPKPTTPYSTEFVVYQERRWRTGGCLYCMNIALLLPKKNTIPLALRIQCGFTANLWPSRWTFLRDALQLLALIDVPFESSMIPIPLSSQPVVSHRDRPIDLSAFRTQRFGECVFLKTRMLKQGDSGIIGYRCLSQGHTPPATPSSVSP
jgi:hypothetical protein